MKIRSLLLAALALTLWGCSNVYYDAMEKVGVHKRDILVDRVEAARDAQSETREQFLTAMEQFRQVVDFSGGDLEREYRRLDATLSRSERSAAEVRERIDAVEDVSEALFDEWRMELEQYSSDRLREQSRRKYEATRARYERLIASMRAAEDKLEPVLVPLRDQVLFIKHNLNARAIAGLSGELARVQADVDRLVRDMDAAIAEADRFIATLRE
jgi:hypothetical protein